MNRRSKPLLVLPVAPLLFVLLAALAPASLAPSTASAEVIWSQPPDLHGFICSSELIEIFGLDTRIADDFSLDRETTITKIVFWGGYYNWSGELRAPRRPAHADPVHDLGTGQGGISLKASDC